MDIRFSSAILITMLLGMPAHAVEMLNEEDMGEVNIFSGQVLEVMGAPAAGQTEGPHNAQNAQPPIEQTVGDVASLAMAFQGSRTDINRPGRDFLGDRDVINLIQPRIPLLVPDQTVVPGPGNTGNTSRTILPGDKNVSSTSVAATDLRGSGIRVLNNTRISEIRREGVIFPQQRAYRTTPINTIVRGLEVSSDATITSR